MRKLFKLFITAMIILSFIMGSLLGYKVNNGDINLPAMVSNNSLVCTLTKNPTISQAIDCAEHCWTSVKIGTVLCYIVIVEQFKSLWVRAP